MKELIKNLTVEWLGSITESVAKNLIKKTKDQDSINKVLQTYNLINPKDDFKSIYQYSYIKYSLENTTEGLGELFSLKSVVDLFKVHFYDNLYSLDDFSKKLINELSTNAFRKVSLTSLYYSRKSVNFHIESQKFCTVFNEAIHAVKTPNEVLKTRKLDKVLDNLSRINIFYDEQLSQFNDNLRTFKSEYYKGLSKKIEKISFYGIELPTINRPREIDLLTIFEKPDFMVYHHDPIIDDAIIDEDEEAEIDDLEKKSDGIELHPLTNGLSSVIIPKGNFVYNLDSFFLKIISTPESKLFYEDLKSPKKRAEIIKKIDGELEISTQDGEEKPLLLNQLFGKSNKIVLLGNPGAGKSSLIKYISLLILKGQEEEIGIKDINNYIPIIIPLNEYNKYKISLNGGIIHFIKDYFKSTYQVISDDILFIANIIQNEKIIFFFDGLDEIFDLNERSDVKNDIELFSQKHINSTVVVSSRFESYQEVFLDKKLFTTYKVNNFDETKINNFVFKWFKADQESNIETKERFINSLEEISSELKSNPLLLTLILLIYKYEKDLPKSKIDIYESCTKTLVERRDEKEKKLEISQKIKSKLSLLSVLAFWQYEVLSKKSFEVISHQSVTNLLTKYLVEKKIIEDYPDAQKNVEIFLEFAKVRSIYFENNFTHKTFLEYLTAYYLYANYQMKGKITERNKILLENVSNSYWYIVIELFMLKVDKESLDSEILDELIITMITEKEEETLKFILPFFPNLNNLNRSVKKTILTSTINQCLNHINNKTCKDYLIYDHLFSILKEKEIYNILEEILSELSNSNSDKELIIFILELQALLNKDFSSQEIKNYLQANYINYPVSWILFHYKEMLNDWPRYFKLMTNFYQEFHSNNKFDFFYSSFGKPLFWNSNKFNWVFSSLFSNINKFVFFKNIQYLKKQKVNSSQLVQKFSNKIDVNLTTNTKLDLMLNKNVAPLINLTIPFKFESKRKDKIPFYSKFQKGKHNRNFKK